MSEQQTNPAQKREAQHLDTRNQNPGRRQKLLVDPKVQGVLLVRIVAYWMLGVVAVGLMMGLEALVAGSVAPADVVASRILLHYGPALLAAVLILPAIVFDCLRATNKFAGPLVRLRNAIRDLADGRPVAPIHFRKNDLYEEFANEFNRLIARVQGPADAKPNRVEQLEESTSHN